MSSYDDYTIDQTRSAALLARILDHAPAGTTFEVLEATELCCKVKVTRPDRFTKPTTVQYTLAEALHAGSLDDEASRQRWKQATADLVHWGCCRRIARRCFPDYTFESLDQQTAPPRTDVVRELDNIEGR